MATESARGIHKEGEYGGRQMPLEAERARLQLLARGNNPRTQDLMTRIGIAPGWQCFEVGAAEGSMTRWMAGRVGPDGAVVAADIDTRFLADLELPNAEVRELDIRTVDDLEPGRFDLAFCRTILLHLPDANVALSKMADTLRPGGILLAQDSDECVTQTADPDHPQSELFEDFHRRVWKQVRASKIFDTRFGRTLPDRMSEVGLVDCEAEFTAKFEQGGSFQARNMQVIFGDYMRKSLVESGAVTDDEIDRVLALYADPAFCYLSGLQVAAWGHRPS